MKNSHMWNIDRSRRWSQWRRRSWDLLKGNPCINFASFESQQRQEVVIELLCDDHVRPLESGYGWLNWIILSWPDVLKFHQLGTLLNSSKYDLYQFHIVYHGTWCAQPAYRGTLSFISSHFHIYIGFSSIKHLNYMIFLSDSLIFFSQEWSA